MTTRAKKNDQEGGPRCPAILISAPASGQGKTTVTAAIARYHRNAGRKVRVFKIGPDYIDPMILEAASGNPVEQLDLWMVGEETCRHRLAKAATEADLILLEGVMGLYDSSPSTADMSRTFGVPVVLVVDASGMAQSFAAMVHGFSTWDPDLAFAGAVANRVGSPGHAGMLAAAMSDDIPLLAHFLRDEDVTLPERHLGLIQAGEVSDLDERLDKVAAQIEGTGLADLPEAVSFVHAPQTEATGNLEGLTIACARDAAFSFIYPANLDCLDEMGAEVVFFSPLAGDALPDCDAVWLPGGYPELHLEALSANTRIKNDLRAAHEKGAPVLAECGGLLYLLDSLENSDGDKADMTAILPGAGKLGSKLSAIGMQSVDTSKGTLRGHTFHYSTLETSLSPVTHAVSAHTQKQGEKIFAVKNLVASYVHYYFPSCPEAIATIFSGQDGSGLFECD